jgi:hypothetical protein
MRATERVNARFVMQNDFPIFMAVMDLAWFRLEVIHPSSPVPTGIGAVAVLDHLQAHLGLSGHTETCERMMALQAVHWIEARRPFQPIGIEHPSSEWMKYYSYVNGTKAFEGKNLSRPASAVAPDFDIPAMPASDGPDQTQNHVIAGGPCSGKTTVVKALEVVGYRVEEETAERLIKAGVAQGRVRRCSCRGSSPAAQQAQEFPLGRGCLRPWVGTVLGPDCLGFPGSGLSWVRTVSAR